MGCCGWGQLHFIDKSKNSYQREVLVDVSIQPVMYYYIPCTIVIGIRI